MKKHLVIIFIILLTVLNATAQEAITDITPSKITVYKTVDETSLSLHIFNPPDHTIDNKNLQLYFSLVEGLFKGRQNNSILKVLISHHVASLPFVLNTA